MTISATISPFAHPKSSQILQQSEFYYLKFTKGCTLSGKGMFDTFSLDISESFGKDLPLDIFEVTKTPGVTSVDVDFKYGSNNV